MNLSTFQTKNTFKRWIEREDIRSHNLDLIQQQRFFDIDSPQRIQKFLSRRGLPDSSTTLLDTGSKEHTEITDIKPGPTLKQFLNLERILGTNDLVNIYFLRDALRISRTVGRIWICDKAGVLRGYGNGFMVSPSLMLTNYHVLPDAETAGNSKIEFNYQLDDEDTISPSQLFELNPDSFYYAFENLDFALIAVQPFSTTGTTLAAYGYNTLLKEEGKAIISQWLNIIQHPAGLPKQVGLRGNQLIDILDDFIHYTTDTSPGSSGSPVYNERWEVVAVHHSGVWQEDEEGNILALNGDKWDTSMGEDQIKWKANEGVRISSILKHVEKLSLPSKQKLLLHELFNPPLSSLETSNIPDNLHSGSWITGNLQVDDNDIVTCNVPVSISFPLKELRGKNPGKDIPFYVSTDAINARPTDVLEQARIAFGKWKGVLGVRMGYVFKNGWITSERAIVVTVKKRKSQYELQKDGLASLPDHFMNYPVEVTGPTIEELIAAQFGQQRLERLFHPTGVRREEIKYISPHDVELKTISQKMNIVAHVSPEEGWKNLKQFIAGTQETLSIAMYDFGAPHILETIDELALKPEFKKLTLAIQAGESVGEGTKVNDLKDEDVMKDLLKKFETKFHSAWIPVGKVNGWVASSYHIKVAVKDHQAMWLSSGNWQSSNQPALEKLKDTSPANLLRTYNREWHIIVENELLSQTYERFIQHDYESNRSHKRKADELMETMNFLLPVNALETMREFNDFETFKPFSENRIFTVTPLLTPDNYHSEVLTLINRAETELLIQNQTFNAPNPGQHKLEELVTAVLRKQQEGVDVKIIFRIVHPASARKNLENLMDMGFHKDSIRLQKNCHNKGIIVDKQKVLIGSQNWSNDGVSVNRDASLLFHDEELASYFRKIFMHDWSKLARQHIGREAYSIELAKDLQNIPKGMELMSWSELRELL